MPGAFKTAVHASQLGHARQRTQSAVEPRLSALHFVPQDATHSSMSLHGLLALISSTKGLLGIRRLSSSSLPLEPTARSQPSVPPCRGVGMDVQLSPHGTLSYSPSVASTTPSSNADGSGTESRASGYQTSVTKESTPSGSRPSTASSESATESLREEAKGRVEFLGMEYPAYRVSWLDLLFPGVWLLLTDEAIALTRKRSS